MKAEGFVYLLSGWIVLQQYGRVEQFKKKFLLGVLEL